MMLGKRAHLRLYELATLLALVVLAGALRLHLYDQIPYPNETADEYAYIWSGWSWLHEGRPTAWSQKSAYDGAPVYLWNQTRYPMPTPWLDHPPLYSLVAGGAATLAGAPEMLDAPLWPARLVSVALGTLAVALLYLLARSAYGQTVAALAGLLFATIPTVVVASRLALAESLIVVLMLVALLATQSYLGGGRGSGVGWLLLAILMTAAASLAKVPGLAVGASVALLLASARRWTPALLAVLAAVAGLVPYLAYGLLSDRKLFLAVLGDQGSRATGLEVLSRMLAGAAMPPVAWPDSWIAFLWLALAYATFRRDRLLAVATAPYLIFLVAAVEQNAPRVWYREPLYPYLCLAGGIFLRDALLRPDVLRTALLTFGVTFGKLAEGLGAWDLLGRAPLGHRLYPLIVAALAAPLVAAMIWPGRPARRALGVLVAGALVVAVVGSVAVVLREGELYPPYRPEYSWPLWVRTSAGLTLTAGWVEPTTLAPGGWLRVSTTWLPERAVAGVPVSAYVRPFDRRSRTSGSPTSVGEAVTLTRPALDQATVEVSGMLPPELPVGDYEVGVRVGDEPVTLGVVRVRAGARLPSAVQGIGAPATLGDVAVLGRGALGSPRPTSAGAAYPVLVSLEGLRSVATGYHAFLHLAAADGKPVAQVDWRPDWRVGESVAEWRDLVVPFDAAPGRYYLTAGLYDLPTGRRLRTPSGGEEVPLGMIEVGPPLGERDVPRRLGTKLAGGVELVGYDLGAEAPDRASGLRLTLYWQTSGPIPQDYTVFVHLVTEIGSKPVAQADGPPDRGRLPTSTWRLGQIIPDPHEVSLAEVPPGKYHVLVGLYQPGDGSRLAVAGRPDGVVEVAAVEVPK